MDILSFLYNSFDQAQSEIESVEDGGSALQLELEEDDNGVILMAGSPDDAAVRWGIQEGDNSCAVSVQKEILESYYGRNFSEAELAQYASENGWYDPDTGTPVNCVGNILEAYGIPVEKSFDTSLSNVFQALATNQKVMVVLDSSEIWDPVHVGDVPVEQTDKGHAVWVTGLQEDSEGNWFVILNDTGTENGQAEKVALEDFLNAWDDYGRFAAITVPSGEHKVETEAGELQTDDKGGNIFNDKNLKAADRSVGGYENRDGTYHWSTPNYDTDKDGNIVRRY